MADPLTLAQLLRGPVDTPTMANQGTTLSSLMGAARDPQFYKDMGNNLTQVPIDTFLGLMGAGGAYNPIFNSTMIHSAVKNDPEGGWILGQNVFQHEGEHKRQYNHPGDYTSEKSMRLAEALAPELKNRGYSRAALPYELMAHMEGAVDHSADTPVDLPHPAWNQMPEETKQWYLQNKYGYLTDKNYQDNVSSYGESIAQFIERVKHIGADSKLFALQNILKAP